MDALKGREKTFSFLVFGCGLALGLTGLYGYYSSRKIRREVRSLSLVVESLKEEVEQLRENSQRQSPSSMLQVPMRTNTVRFHDEADAASDIASGDEEFFDFTETETHEIGDENSVESAAAQINEWFGDSKLDKKVLYAQVEELCERFHRPASLLCLLTKASNFLVTRAAKEGNEEEKKRLAFQTLKLGDEALGKDPDSAECHKWYAIAIGGVSDFVPVKEKIQNGSQFKEHVDIAIALSPNDATLHHMLGRFCQQIANLSWIERKVASTLFGQVPAVTLQDAVQHLQHAYDLKRDWKENILHLVKCSIELKLMDSVRSLIKEGVALPIRGEDDEICHKELLLLKSRYLK